MRCGIGLDGVREGWSIGIVSFDGPGSMAAVFSRNFSRFALMPLWLLVAAALLPLSSAHAVRERLQSTKGNSMNKVMSFRMIRSPR